MRPRGHPTGRRGVRGQHPRQRRPHTPRARDPGDQIPPRTAPTTTRELHADKAYDSRDLRDWLRDRGITPRLARKGIESNTTLGRHRWIIERTIAWLFGYRRLTTRYERHTNLFHGFLTLAAALTCYKKTHQMRHGLRACL